MKRCNFVLLFTLLIFVQFCCAITKADNELQVNLKAKPKFIVLSVDGGGIRGIVPARILQELEERIGKPISDLVNLSVGTSTGGIIVTALNTSNEHNRPKYKAEDLVDLYQKRGKDIFSTSIWRKAKIGLGLWGAKYDRSNLDNILTQMLGESLLSEALKPIMVISYSLSGDGIYGDGINFWSSRVAKTADKKDFYLKDIAGATSAAPTFFEPKTLLNKTKNKTYIESDGGIFANNPTVMAIAEARLMNPSLNLEDILLISIGTGRAKLNQTSESLKDSGVIGWLMRADLIGVMMGANSELTEWEISILNLNNIRIQLDIDKELSEMDNVSDKNIQALLHETERYIQKNDQAIDKLCGILKGR